MPQVDLYDNAYAKVEHDLYREIRTETYGHDLGQTSWVTTAESESIPALLNLTTPEPTPPGATVLELGCGSGLYALHVVNRFAVQPFAPPHQLRITGIDLNPNAIASAQRRG